MSTSLRQNIGFFVERKENRNEVDVHASSGLRFSLKKSLGETFCLFNTGAWVCPRFCVVRWQERSLLNY